MTALTAIGNDLETAVLLPASWLKKRKGGEALAAICSNLKTAVLSPLVGYK